MSMPQSSSALVQSNVGQPVSQRHPPLRCCTPHKERRKRARRKHKSAGVYDVCELVVCNKQCSHLL